MNTLQAIKVFLAKRRRVRELRSIYKNYNQKLDSLFEELVDVDPDSKTAIKIREQIDEISSSLHALHFFNRI